MIEGHEDAVGSGGLQWRILRGRYLHRLVEWPLDGPQVDPITQCRGDNRRNKQRGGAVGQER